jgi:RNA polymerase sigma factor for flagellar operon FliA
MTHKELKELWTRYRRHRRPADLNALMARYDWLARCVAQDYQEAHAPNIPCAELVGAARVGLWEAITRYCPESPASFRTFAWRRVYGAIVDWGRDTNIRSRTLSGFERNQADAHERLQQDGIHPTDDQIATEMGLSIDHYKRRVRWARANAVVSLDFLKWSKCDENRHGFDFVDPRAGMPDDSICRQWWIDRVCRGLSPAERIVLVGYFLDDLTLAELGRVIGLSESRVCQILHEALARLRERFADCDLADLAA